MRSSIFNSRPRLWIAVLLGSSLLFCGGLEIITRIGFHRISHIRHRIETQYRAAVTIGRARDRSPVLVLGNSLLVQGVDFAALDVALAPDLRPQPFLLENTGYTDWYFGLRRLFALGSRPSLVVLGLSTRQLISER